jgi:adhesin/invasin
VAGSQTFIISGIRANVAASGLRAGSFITALLATSSFSLTNPSPIIGIVTPGLGQGSGFPDNPLNIIACSPAIPAPAGLPDSIAGNPDPSPSAANSLRLVFVEGFGSAFAPASREDGGTGLHGTRLRAQFTGIPEAIIPYAPRAVRVTSGSQTGSVLPPGSSLVIQRVGGVNPDGSGGTVLPEVPDQFDRIPVSGGTATLVYEVTSDSTANLDTVTLLIALAAASNPGSATIAGSFGLAPVGPPTSAPARPQFTASTRLVLSSRELSFVQYIGSTPDPKTVSFLNAGAGILNWSATASTESGGNWLSVTPASGTDNGSISVSIVDNSLSSATYHGTVTITDAHAVNSPQTIAVTLIVTPRPTFSVTPTALSFQAAPGASPPSRQLTILSSGSGVPWTATVETTSGGGWLGLSSVSGITGSVVNVFAGAAGLAPGAYQGSITFTAVDSVNKTETIPVSLIVGPPYTVVSGASFLAGPGLSPGMIAVLFGSNLTDIAALAPPGMLPTLLRNTQVLVNGVAAPLFYVSPTQINFQVPLGISGNTAQVVVATNGILGPAVTVNVAGEAPGIFTVAETGKGAILNQNSTLNSEGNPAQAGSVIQIFATGLGAVSPAVPAGQPAPVTPLSETVTTPVVQIGGIPAEITYSGLAPGTVGVHQVNARIPEGVTANASVSVLIRMGSVASNEVSIAVQ